MIKLKLPPTPTLQEIVGGIGVFKIPMFWCQPLNKMSHTQKKISQTTLSYHHPPPKLPRSATKLIPNYQAQLPSASPKLPSSFPQSYQAHPNYQAQLPSATMLEPLCLTLFGDTLLKMHRLYAMVCNQVHLCVDIGAVCAKHLWNKHLAWLHCLPCPALPCPALH